MTGFFFVDLSPRLWEQPGFRRFWTASTVSALGSPVTGLAVQILVVVNLQASNVEVGVVRTAQWLPYLAFGLLAGALVDRIRRRLSVLWLCDLGRACLLAIIPALHVLGLLNLVGVVAVLFAFGFLSVANDAAAQSVLPRLVDHRLLAAANARLQQSHAVAQTSGPLFAGVLVRIVGAPAALLVDACSFVASGLLLRSIRVVEAPRPEDDLPQRRHLGREIAEGARWVYRHEMLAPMAIWTHVWFFFNAIVTTVFVPYAVRDLGVDAFGIGVAYACAGVGSVLGGAMAGWAGRRLGVGGAVIGSQFVLAVAFLPIVSAPAGLLGLIMVCVGQLLFGVGIGLGSPHDMAYRQAVTPDRLQGRMNATIRSLNWGMIAVAAPLGGLLADMLGYRPAVWVGIAGVALTAFGLLASPFRRASMPTSRTT
jgi:MFS family permease